MIFCLLPASLEREKSVPKPWTFGELEPDYVFASKYRTGQGSHGTGFCTERLSLSALEPTPLNKVQLKGHSAHLGFGRVRISLLFVLRMDLNHTILPWSPGICDCAALF